MHTITDPVPGAWGGPAATGFFLAGVLAALRTAHDPYPRPGSTVDQIQAYFQGSSGAARVSVAGQLASAAALLSYGGAIARLARPAAAPLPAGPGLASAARVASIAAAATLAGSALSSAALTGPAGRSRDHAARLHRQSFLAGGPLHTASLGLLTAVLSIAGWRTRQLPRPLAIVAGASAAAGMLSPLYLITDRAVLLIPAGRFSALLTAATSGTLLARRRTTP